MVNFNEVVGVRISSLNDCSLAFGHKSALDTAGATYNRFTFTTTSACYNSAECTTVAHIGILFNTLVSDLEKKGVLIKG